VPIISFTSLNSVLLIHHEFAEGGGVRCILVVSIIVFLRGVLCIFLLHVHVYIRASGPQMNTSAIPNSSYSAHLLTLITHSMTKKSHEQGDNMNFLNQDVIDHCGHYSILCLVWIL
jgi:hypothetical protein